MGRERASGVGCQAADPDGSANHGEQQPMSFTPIC